MRVLFIAGLYAPYIAGGAEITLRDQAIRLKNAGHEVAVLSIGPQPGLHKEEMDGITVWRAGVRNVYFFQGANNRPRWQKALWHMLDIYKPQMRSFVHHVVQDFRPDVASCHNLPGWSVALWGALTANNVPIVQVLHDQYLLCTRSTMFKNMHACQKQCLSCKLMRLPHAYLSNQVTAVVGVSAFIKDKLVANGYFKNTPIKIHIHNRRPDLASVHVKEARPLDGTVVFGFIGTLAQNKGIEQLLTAFRQCSEPHWRLLVAGKGEENYVAELQKCHADSRIEFIGYSKPGEFFPRLDFSVVPSIWEETFAGVVFESLVYGVPVLATTRGGTPEMMIDGLTGLLFDPNDLQSFVSGLRCMAENLSDWREKRPQIRLFGEKFTNSHEWISEWINVYSRAMAAYKWQDK